MNTELNKIERFEQVADEIQSLGFSILKKDYERPWGGFFVIDEKDAEKFASLFFPHLEFSKIQITQKLSPKILIVAPNKRLSWQYHFKRAEIWKVIMDTTVGVKIANSDEEPSEIRVLSSGNFIQMDKGERHRLIGLDNWGIVAEIWQHTDAQNPSDEEDIIRIQDDFGR